MLSRCREDRSPNGPNYCSLYPLMFPGATTGRSGCACYCLKALEVCDTDVFFFHTVWFEMIKKVLTCDFLCKILKSSQLKPLKARVPSTIWLVVPAEWFPLPFNFPLHKKNNKNLLFHSITFTWIPLNLEKEISLHDSITYSFCVCSFSNTLLKVCDV